MFTIASINGLGFPRVKHLGMTPSTTIHFAFGICDTQA